MKKSLLVVAPVRGGYTVKRFVSGRVNKFNANDRTDYSRLAIHSPHYKSIRNMPTFKDVNDAYRFREKIERAFSRDGFFVDIDMLERDLEYDTIAW